jgi:hypothetical protein
VKQEQDYLIPPTYLRLRPPISRLGAARLHHYSGNERSARASMLSLTKKRCTAASVSPTPLARDRETNQETITV